VTDGSSLWGTDTRHLSYIVGTSANRITDDSRWARANHRQADIDNLFSQWESDPLELLSLPDLGMNSAG
jgi:hypothetical protein